MALHDLLSAWAVRSPAKIALVTDGSRHTYGELGRSVAGLASHLRRQGVEPGDRVIVFVPNSAPTVIGVFGVLRAGAVIVIVDPTAPAERLRHVLENSGARVIIATAANLSTVRAAASGVVAPHLIVVDAMGDDLVDFVDACASPADVDVRSRPDDHAAIIYTSGSTGRPKGVTLTHHSVETVVSSVAGYLDHTPDDVVLCVLQLAFGYGLLQILVTFATGGTVVLERGFGLPFDLVKRITAERVTGLAGVPTLWAMLLQLRNLGDHDLSSVRYLTNAAANMPQSFIDQVRRAFPSAALYLMHGQTECLRTTFLPPDQLPVRPTSVGLGMPGVELWLEDADGTQVPLGETGELIVRGDGVMVGYWNDPTATAEVLRPGRTSRERVLRTRDLFRTDSDGYFYFVARTDDIIKCRGEKVSPLEIEELLYARPEVFEARVIGVADDVLGHAIRAEVVLKSGHALGEAELRRYLRLHLEPYKMPQTIEFVGELPKTSGGKILRTP